MSNLEEQEYFTITQAAKVKGCTRKTVYSMIQTGQIKIEIIAGHKLIANTEEFRRVNPKSHHWKRSKQHKDQIEQLEERVERLEATGREQERRLLRLERKLMDLETRDQECQKERK